MRRSIVLEFFMGGVERSFCFDEFWWLKSGACAGGGGHESRGV